MLAAIATPLSVRVPERYGDAILSARDDTVVGLNHLDSKQVRA